MFNTKKIIGRSLEDAEEIIENAKMISRIVEIDGASYHTGSKEEYSRNDRVNLFVKKGKVMRATIG